jgi:formylglycine-generating enzyme required for sulfatase activity
MNFFSILILVFLPLFCSSQNDSLFIEIEYNRLENNNNFDWYSTIGYYPIKLSKSQDLKIPNYSYINPIEQKFVDKLKISAYCNETTRLLDSSFISKSSLEVPLVKIDSFMSKLNEKSIEAKYETIKEKFLQPFIDSLMEPFYFSNYEISNKEYREFVNWVKDSIAFNLAYEYYLEEPESKYLLNLPKRKAKKLDILKWKENLAKYGFNYDLDIYNDPKYIPSLANLYYPQPERYYKRREIDVRKLNFRNDKGILTNVYPDTNLLLNKDSSLSDNLFAQTYFCHPAFDDYPVQFIAYNQAEAFCEWKQKQINREFSNKGIEFYVSLPSLYDYEMGLKFNQSFGNKDDVQNIKNDQILNLYHTSNDEKFFYLWSVDGKQKYQKDAQIYFDSIIINYTHQRSVDWYRSNQDGPLLFLNGNLSEYCSSPLNQNFFEYFKIDSTSIDMNNLSDYCLILGSNANNLLLDKKGNQINTLFYKQIVRKDERKTFFGFRPIIRIKKTI